MLGYVLCASPLIVLLAIVFTLAPEDPLSLPVAGIVLVLVAAGFVLAQVVGYTVAPLQAGLDEDEARRRSVQAYQERMILRFVLTEAPVIASLALAFVVGQGPWPFALAVLLGVPSMAYHVLVSARAVQRVQAGLEAGGVRSHLPEALAA
jgi:hypothetical protein